MIVDLDELNIRELFEAQHQWTRDVVKRPIRLATACKIEISAAIRKCNPAIACKTVIDHRQSLVAFHITRSLEEFIEHCIDDLFGGGNHAPHCHLIGQLTSN